MREASTTELGIQIWDTIFDFFLGDELEFSENRVEELLNNGLTNDQIIELLDSLNKIGYFYKYAEYYYIYDALDISKFVNDHFLEGTTRTPPRRDPLVLDLDGDGIKHGTGWGQMSCGLAKVATIW